MVNIMCTLFKFLTLSVFNCTSHCTDYTRLGFMNRKLPNPKLQYSCANFPEDNFYHKKIIIFINQNLLGLPDNFSIGIEKSNLVHQVILLGIIDQVALVEDDDVSELNLVHHQLRDGSLHFTPAVVESFHTAEVIVEIRGVNQSDAGVQSGHLAKLRNLLV